MNGDFEHALRITRMAFWHDATMLADVAFRENRPFTPAEQQRWEILNAEIAALDARLARMRGFLLMEELAPGKLVLQVRPLSIAELIA